MPVSRLLYAFSPPLFTSFSPSFSPFIPALALVFCATNVAQGKTWTTKAPGLQNSINKARNGDTVRVTGGSTKNKILVKKRLTIEGKGSHTLSGTMTVKASGTVVRNLSFRNVSYKSRSASISVSGAHNVRVENNNISGSRGMGIFVGNSHDVKVTGNKIRDVRCMNGTSGYSTAQGIKIGQNSKRTIVTNNSVVGLQGCRTTAAFYCDTGGTNGLFKRNRVSRVGKASGDAIGIYVESRCHNWDVVDNIISDVETGVRNGSPGSQDPNNTLIKDNFITAKKIGVKIIRGKNVTVTNNDIKAPVKIYRRR